MPSLHIFTNFTNYTKIFLVQRKIGLREQKTGRELGHKKTRKTHKKRNLFFLTEPALSEAEWD
jgi:hypothetical protein